MLIANGSGVCRANSGDLRKQSRKAGAGIARWSFGITPCYAQSIIFKHSKLFEIRQERPTGYTRAVDAQAQDRECEAQRDCSDCASTFDNMATKGLRAISYQGTQKVEAGYNPSHTTGTLIGYIVCWQQFFIFFF